MKDCHIHSSVNRAPQPGLRIRCLLFLVATLMMPNVDQGVRRVELGCKTVYIKNVIADQGTTHLKAAPHPIHFSTFTQHLKGFQKTVFSFKRLMIGFNLISKGCGMMKFKTLMMIKAFVCVILGIPILMVPRFFYGIFGVSLDAAGIFPAWEYGASLMGNALVTWYARHARESTGRRAIIRGMTVYNSIGFIVTMIAILTGVMNPLGWVAVVIYLFFALGFGYFWLKPPTP